MKNKEKKKIEKVTGGLNQLEFKTRQIKSQREIELIRQSSLKSNHPENFSS